MTIKLDNIKISRKEKELAKLCTYNIENKLERKKQFLTISIAASLKKYFENFNFEYNIDSSIFQIPKLNQFFQFCDTYINDVRIDFGFVFDQKQPIALSKSPFVHSLLPKFYLICLVTDDLRFFDTIGFLTSDNIDIISKDENFIFVNPSSIIPFDTFFNRLQEQAKTQSHNTFCEHEIEVRSDFIKFLDNKLTDKKIFALTEHLINCPICRKMAVDYYRFEKKVIGKDRYPQEFIIQANQIIELEIENYKQQQLEFEQVQIELEQRIENDRLDNLLKEAKIAYQKHQEEKLKENYQTEEEYDDNDDINNFNKEAKTLFDNNGDEFENKSYSTKYSDYLYEQMSKKALSVNQELLDAKKAFLSNNLNPQLIEKEEDYYDENIQQNVPNQYLSTDVDSQNFTQDKSQDLKNKSSNSSLSESIFKEEGQEANPKFEVNAFNDPSISEEEEMPQETVYIENESYNSDSNRELTFDEYRKLKKQNKQFNTSMQYKDSIQNTSQKQEDVQILYKYNDEVDNSNNYEEGENLNDYNPLYSEQKEMLRSLVKNIVIFTTICSLFAIGISFIKHKNQISNDENLESIEHISDNIDSSNNEEVKIPDDMINFDESGVEISKSISENNSTKLSKPKNVSLSALSWQLSQKYADNDEIKDYLQKVGKNLRLNLQNNFLTINEIIYTKEMKVEIILSKNSMPIATIEQSSGSTRVDEIVLNTVNNTLKYIKRPIGILTEEKSIIILSIKF